MICVRLMAKPTQRSAHYGKATGAFVNCWIDFPDPGGAVVLAKKYIADGKWEVCEVKPVLTGFSRLAKVPKFSRPYYSEALKFGYSLVFYCWQSKSDKAMQSRSSVFNTKARKPRRG